MKALYRLSPKGVDLIPALIEIVLWGEKHLSNSDESLPFLKDVKKNKAKFLKTIINKLNADEVTEID